MITLLDTVCAQAVMQASTFLNLFLFCQMGQWHEVDEHDGQVREIKLRSLCNNPMCPPDTAMTERQHIVFSSDKKKLVSFVPPY